MLTKGRKLFRYTRLYGFDRTLSKVTSRLGRATFVARARSSADADTAFIGCGQFCFSTIAYFLDRFRPRRTLVAYDVDEERSRLLCKRYGGRIASHIDQLFAEPALGFLYIASNHHSHTEYAIIGLRRGLSVYVEKPVSVTWEQLSKLYEAERAHPGKLYVGYNRPFSSAVRIIHDKFKSDGVNSPVTLTCHVTGHFIEQDHWYRDPKEGTRVCGNMGHWIDLAVHILSWRHLPDRLRILIAFTDKDTPDDNLSVSLTSDFGDLITIVLTSRCEPFEGINETINLNAGPLIAKIDDFRKLDLWLASDFKTYRFRPKDVGHSHAIVQPFQETHRDWEEVVKSSCLMLFVTDMVREHRVSAEFSFRQALARLERG